jgi:hypothetical protein
MNTNNTNIDIMYKLPKIYGNNNEKKIVLPNIMYKMNKIYHNFDNNLTKSPTNLLLNVKDFEDNGLAENALKDLESRQRLLLSRIKDLEKGLDERLELKTNDLSIKRIESQKDSNVSNKRLKSSSVRVEDNENAFKSVKDIVIFSNPKQMPFSVFAVIKSMKTFGLKVLLNIHKHSSLHIKIDSHFDQILSSIDLNIQNNSVINRLENDLMVTIILKNTEEDYLILSPLDLTPITSEATILRFMARIAAQLKPELSYLYEGIDDILRLTSVDNFVDQIHKNLFINSINDTKYYSELNSKLNANKYLTGKSPSIADLLLWSAINRNSSKPKLSPTLNEWFNNTQNFIATQIF